jgi:hypothetical protein
MAVSDSKDLIAGGCDSIRSRIGARRLSNCFCFLLFLLLLLLFEAVASVVAWGGGRFEADFEADLAFLPRCVGVMVAGPSLSLGMVNLGWKQDDQRKAKTPMMVALKVSFLVYE